MRLAVREVRPGRLALVDVDRDGAVLPYPVGVSACAWDWWDVPSRFGVAGPSAQSWYGTGREARARWAREHGALMERAGLTSTGLYVDVPVWARPASTLWGWPCLVPTALHARELGEAARRGDVAYALRLLETGKEGLLSALGREGRSSESVVAVCGWNELAWNLLLEGVGADQALGFSSEVLRETRELLRTWFPRALIALDRVAGSLRKDRPESGWIGRRGWVGPVWSERDHDDPSSHFWRYLRATGAGDVLALNAYSDDPEREDHRLDAVHGALVDWGRTGALVVSEQQWAPSKGWPHRLLWAQFAYPGAPPWGYPWGGTAEESATLHGRAILGDVRRGYVVATCLFGWTAHYRPTKRVPLGHPWGPVIPTVPGPGLREYRDMVWIDALRRHIDAAREQHRRLT